MPSSPSTPIHDGRSLAILYVDDEALLRRTMEHALTGLGHTVVCAGDGQEALNYLAGRLEHFQAVITDHTMPVMTGLELVRRLRAVGYNGLVFVFASPLRPKETEEYRAMRVAHILEKPHGFAQLPALISRFG